jgi:hypothetical protein
MKKKRRRGKPNDLKNIIHDRTSHDLLRNAQVAPVEVDDPYEEGGKIVVLRSTRNDPLADMKSKRQIDQCDYVAGRHWQAAWESAEIGGVRAIAPTREAVDGGSLPELLTDTQRRAVQDLKAAREALGREGHLLVCDVLGADLSITQTTCSRGLSSEADRRYTGKRFRECLSNPRGSLRLRQPGRRGAAAIGRGREHAKIRLDECHRNQQGNQHGKSAEGDIEEIAGKSWFMGQHDTLRSDADRYNATQILMHGNRTG